jgi:FMN phosphatase YigB (HAD superfamily)
VKPEQTLFIDDRDANVETAITLGGYAIKYESVLQLASDLKALQFPVLPPVAPRDGANL